MSSRNTELLRKPTAPDEVKVFQGHTQKCSSVNTGDSALMCKACLIMTKGCSE